MEDETILTLECPCGTVFEPESEEVDGQGERWTRCPKCQKKIPIPENR